LDEPTSNLDRPSEERLRSALTELSKDRNVILVTYSPILLAACPIWLWSTMAKSSWGPGQRGHAQTVRRAGHAANPEIDDMNPLESLVAASPLPRIFSGAGLVMGIIVEFLGWAYYAELDEVAVASGKIVPKGQVKVIQYLEGSIIHKINVTEGQKILAGAPLVQLQLGAETINRDEVEIETNSLLLERARLEAESTGGKLIFPKGLATRYDGMVSAERKAYESRRRQWQNIQVIFREQTTQKTHAIPESTARLKGIKEKLKLAEWRFVMSKDLLASKLVPKMEHLELEDEVTSLRAEVDELSKRLHNPRAAHAEARERERTGLINFQRAVIEEPQQVELSIARNRELITKIGDQSSRREISSPIYGIVKICAITRWRRRSPRRGDYGDRAVR
jgi:adhesin transport system membrane fusion protein